MKLRAMTVFTVAMLMVSPVFAAATTAPTATTTPTATTSTTPTATTASAMTPAKPKGKVHYYIAQATDTKVCSVVTTKPDGKTATMVGKYWYATEAAATAALKHQAACKTS